LARSNTAIDTADFVRIGGIDQWVAIRGSDRRNPVALFLHGGPAEAQSPFLADFQPWLKRFTVVNWDQRGAGKTFGKNGTATPDMTLERLTSDAIDVAQYACRELGQQKVILIGHSWGAILGMQAVKQRPDSFHAFVGSGQPVRWSLSMAAQARWTRDEALRRGDNAILKTLDDTAALPITDWKRIAAVNAYRWTADDLAHLAKQRAFIGAPGKPRSSEAADWVGGGAFSVPKLLPAIFAFDAYALAPMPVPFFVIQGKDDHVVSFDAAATFVESLQAPAKGFIPMEGGHFALFTNGTDFAASLNRHVLPLTDN
jgi:pimeloyl-ACP methyl ester carboxylesterase